MSRLIIISNRLPFSIEKKGDEKFLRESSGGLVSALNSYFELTKTNPGKFDNKLWVGSADFSPQDWETIAPRSNEDYYLARVIVSRKVPNKGLMFRS